MGEKGRTRIEILDCSLGENDKDYWAKSGQRFTFHFLQKIPGAPLFQNPNLLCIVVM
jgi:hypothetical protein